MKNITLILATLLCGTSSSLVATEDSKQPVAVEQVVMEQKLGKEEISQVREDYEAGRYDAFLREMNEAFEAVIKKNKLSNLSILRKNAMTEPKWDESFDLLQKERNKQLIEAIEDQDSFFAEKVRFVAADLISSDQKEAIYRMANLRQMAPGTGKNKDENRLIDIDLEYEFKSIHLDMPILEGQSVADRREKQYVLRMEKMDKMLTAAQAFADTSLKEAVELTARGYDDRLAQNWDYSDLNSLIKGKTKPIGVLQEKVVSIFQEHQDKISELAKQYLQSEKVNQHAASK